MVCSTGFLASLKTSPSCILSCDPPYFANTATGSCQLCADDCAGCLDYDTNACTSCPPGTFLNSSTATCDSSCSDTYFADTLTNTCQSCATGCDQCSSSSASSCTLCSSGYYFDIITSTCVQICPLPFMGNNTDRTCRLCPPGQYYLDGICYTLCPSTYYEDSVTTRCLDCYMGCNTCQDGTKNGCLSCSSGYYYFSDNGTCQPTCPPSQFIDHSTNNCETCPSPCNTCHNLTACTSCLPGYYLLNVSCVSSCPDTFYIGTLLLPPIYEIPACVGKVTLAFNLSLTSQARAIRIMFNNGVDRFLLHVAKLLQVQINGTQVDSSMYDIALVSESEFKFTYIADQYIAPGSLLNITLDISSDFNTDPYERFATFKKSATIQMMEVYPFSDGQLQVVAAASQITNIVGATIASGQATTALAGGGLSFGMVRIQIIGETIQILRYIDIRWPPVVTQYFSISTMNPDSPTLPIDLTPFYNNHLESMNYSMPRIFQEYEISPFVTKNYNNELSNIFLFFSVVLSALISLKILKKILSKVFNGKVPPKKNTKTGFLVNLCQALANAIQRVMRAVEGTALKHFLFLYIFNVYQSGILWSVLNIKHNSALLDPRTPHTEGSFGLAVFTLASYIILMAWAFWKVTSTAKYIINSTEEQWPRSARSFGFFYEELMTGKKIQLYYIPFTLLRGLLTAGVVATLTKYPMVQISIVWAITILFDFYLIKYTPLSKKWERRFTTIAEVFALCCVTIGEAVSIVCSQKDLDPSTLNEIGFVFLAFAVASTVASAIVTLLQVIALIQKAFQRFKRWRTSRTQIFPATPAGLTPRVENSQIQDHGEATLSFSNSKSLRVQNESTSLLKNFKPIRTIRTLSHVPELNLIVKKKSEASSLQQLNPKINIQSSGMSPQHTLLAIPSKSKTSLADITTAPTPTKSLSETLALLNTSSSTKQKIENESFRSELTTKILSLQSNSLSINLESSPKKPEPSPKRLELSPKIESSPKKLDPYEILRSYYKKRATESSSPKKALHPQKVGDSILEELISSNKTEEGGLKPSPKI